MFAPAESLWNGVDLGSGRYLDTHRRVTAIAKAVHEQM
jgi:hypothetical protein